MDYTDDVRGIVIGGDGVRYEFWTEEDVPQFIAREYFTAEHPATFARGAEMRVYDRV